MPAKIKNILSNLSYPYGVFGLFGMITYPLYYFLWSLIPGYGYDNFYMRLVAVLLCTALFLEKYWPKVCRNYLIHFWYVAITYCLPFFFTFILFNSQFNFPSILNTFIVIVLSIFLLRKKQLLLSLAIGGTLGWLAYYLTSSIPISHNVNYWSIIFSYATVIVFGMIFAYRHDQVYEDRIKLLKHFSGNLAHELRTPLGTIALQTSAIKKNLSEIISGFDIAKKENLIDTNMSPTQVVMIPNSLSAIEKETKNASMFIDNLLVNFDNISAKSSLTPCSMKKCINNAIENYPFTDEQRSWVRNEAKQDFLFLGNESIMLHIFLNLIKNSIFHLCESNKSKCFIKIKTSTEKKYNTLIFEDNGSGIEKKSLKRIFEHFYTNRLHGTGIGLSFCKEAVKAFDGEISCKSEYGKYTIFIIKFPVVEANEQ